jgi:DHA2 family multidrug resistance protein-like MFS transporter
MSIALERSPVKFQGLPVPRRYWAAAAIWLALTISVLDASIANVALPTIAKHLSAPPAEAVWVVNAYQLTIVISLLPLAAVGQMVGFRYVFEGGVVLFTVASLGCTFAHSIDTLAIARAVQGIGAAGIMSENGALVRFTYPPGRLGRGLGMNALVISAAAALGPTVAAGILAVGPWEWLFAVNVPIGIATFLIGRKSLPANPTSGSFDLIGTILNVLTFGPIFIGIDFVTRGGVAWIGSTLIVVGVVAGLFLVLRALGQRQPIMPVDLLKSTIFALSVSTAILSFSAQMLAFVSLPFYFEGWLHFSQVKTGMMMTPWPVSVGIGAPVAGWLADRFSGAILSGVGLLVLAIGLLLLASLPEHVESLDIVWRMALCGLGFGLFQAPNNRSILSSAPMERSSAAGGMLATARLIGQTFGATLAAICLRLTGHVETFELTLAATLAVLASIVSMVRVLHPHGKRPSKLVPITTGS